MSRKFPYPCVTTMTHVLQPCIQDALDINRKWFHADEEDANEYIAQISLERSKLIDY